LGPTRQVRAPVLLPARIARALTDDRFFYRAPPDSVNSPADSAAAVAPMPFSDWLPVVDIKQDPWCWYFYEPSEARRRVVVRLGFRDF
jgi:hypothetical protein